ncbi:uncharacterized protein LOC126703929 [Quercus robur]|uniref:uncharacterized protein LOC126703929 n=1 Tax=Quercus robur TaxID=38942 RepID=UPI002163D8F4|nr:uncharacterized protein LOC126703929 [Quercus robur]
MAQRMEEKFSTFEIEHAPRNENRFADALAALGLQIIFKGDSTRIEVSKREESIIEVLKEKFQEEQGKGDWRIPIKEVLIKGDDVAELKILKDYALWVEAVPLRNVTGGAVANFIKENIIVRFGVPYRIISDNGTPFINSDVRKMLEFYQVKYHRSSPYYPQGNGQAEATNKTLIKIISKMSQEYTGGWTTHLPDALWAYRKSPKSATGFSPFSLIYGTEVVSPVEIMTPSLRVMQTREKEKEEKVFVAERCEDLEGLDGKREKAQECSRRYRQKMTEAYGRMTKERVFAEEQLVLKVADYVRQGLAGPSKFAPKWEGPLVIREAHQSGYYRLTQMDGRDLMDPINGKWLKRYYA